jgi:Ca2+/Na+ antiporter
MSKKEHFNIFEHYETILKGFITGILIGYVLIYGLRPSVRYPDLILEFFENKWIFLILLLIIYYSIIWDLRIGVLMLLSTIALIFDYIIFTDTFNQNKENMNNNVDTNIQNNFPLFI